jgi:uncharacterized RmlC-like cupin family protein
MDAVRVIRPALEAEGRQALGYFLGVSGETCGSTGLAMHLVVVPPGGAAEPHLHDGYETAIYQLEGLVETRYGEGLPSRWSPGRVTSSSSRRACRTRR